MRLETLLALARQEQEARGRLVGAGRTILQELVERADRGFRHLFVFPRIKGPGAAEQLIERMVAQNRMAIVQGERGLAVRHGRLRVR